MHLLFVHFAFPAQFGQLALELNRMYGWKCSFLVKNLSRCPSPSRAMLEKLEVVQLPGPVSSDDDTPWPQVYGNWLTRGQALVDAVRGRPGLRPDLVVGHGGLMPTMLLREVLACPIIDFCEYFFAASHRDLTYRVDLPPAELAPFYSRCINSRTLVNMLSCDGCYTATNWQRQSFPSRFHSKMEVHFEGIDAELYKPRAMPRVFRGREIPADVQIVTFAARGLEAMRGFDIFLRVAARIARERPNVLFVVAGDERIYYGWDKLQTGNPSFKGWALSQVDVEPSRLLFVGHIEPDELSHLLCLSDLHLYLTVPFVLSWSVIDVLACGCVVLASDVGPVRELIRPDDNGLVEPLFDVDRLVKTSLRVLDDPGAFQPMRRQARLLVQEQYSVEVCVPRLKEFFERQAAGSGLANAPGTPGRD